MLRGPKRASVWAVSTSALLGSEVERRKATLEATALPAERMATPRVAQHDMPSPTLRRNDERSAARQMVTRLTGREADSVAMCVDIAEGHDATVQTAWSAKLATNPAP